MVFHTILPKIAAHWLINLYRAARNAFQYYRNSTTKPSTAAASRCTIPSAADRTVVCDFHGGLLRSTTLFPYFMLVAFEGGSLLRALLLLCSFPLVWVLGERADVSVGVMAFVTFVGLRPRDADLVAQAILPKFYMERLNAQVYDHLWLPARRKVAVTRAPRVMLEWFLKEYMAADVVVGCELQMVMVGRGWYFTGLLCGPGPGLRMIQKALIEVLGEEGAMADVAVVGSSNTLDHLFIPYCKKSCELGSKYADLEKEKSELQLDLEITKKNLERAQADLKALGGKLRRLNAPLFVSFIFQPSDLTRTDVRGENRRLQARLNNAVSLDTMKKALEDKDKSLAEAQKTAREKTEAAEKKLAASSKLEEENTKLKQERADWGKRIEQATKRSKGLEKYLGDFAKKMYIMLEEFCQDFDKETEELEPNLDPTKSPVGDAVAMNMFRLEARLASVQGYVTRLKAAVEKIDKELWPEDTLQTDLESVMIRLIELPGRVQAWKKSAARCGADVALSLVRVHCKEAKEDRLKALQVANTKKLQFQDFMETFIAAATRITDGIDLDTFVEPSSPSGA